MNEEKRLVFVTLLVELLEVVDACMVLLYTICVDGPCTSSRQLAQQADSSYHYMY